MKQICILACLLVAVFSEDPKNPLYKYRYETEDVMKTAASTIPIHGYHVVEGGYYPAEAGYGVEGGEIGLGGAGLGLGGAGLGHGGLIGAGGYGGQFLGGKLGYGGLGYGAGLVEGGGLAGPGYGIGPIGYGGVGLKPGFVGPIYGGAGLAGAGVGGAEVGYRGAEVGYRGAGVGLGGGQLIGAGPVGYVGGVGGEEVDKNVYSGGKKNLNDETFEKVNGNKGEAFNHGHEGYTAGKAAAKDIKGDSAYYNEEEGGKKLFEDEKAYHGAQKYDQEGLAKGEKKIQQGHKKGHYVKGFKTSHHKDESGKTEEYYDAENDEGNHFDLNTHGGSFAENSGSHFKGGHEDGKFNAGEAKKQGHYSNEHFADNSNAGKGQFGEKKYAGNGAVYGVNNGVDEHSLSGHQESERFYKHHPHVPYY